MQNNFSAQNKSETNNFNLSTFYRKYVSIITLIYVMEGTVKAKFDV